MRNSKRGIALITALLISVILMMMLVTLIMQSRQGLLFTGGHRKGVAALHVAEAGLADALFEINQNRGWEEGFDKKPMRHGPGNYTIVFNLDPGLAAVEADESVNNLEGLGAVNGPRGPGTVPAGTAELVVLANVEGGQRRLQVLLSSESLDLGAIPVLATGRIRLQRNVEVFALESLQESQKLEAGIHSNQAGSEEDVILWEAEPGDTALVTGTVSVTGNNPEAINFNDPDGAAVLGDQKISQPAVSIPDFDIATQVAAKSSSPSPPPAGAGAVTLSGATSMSTATTL